MVPVAEREGKTKILQPGPSPDQLTVTYKDSATAFNGGKFAVLPGKGALNAQISILLFQALAQAGIPTCFVQPGDTPTTMVYRRLTMLPLEVVVRNAAYGSVCKRFGLAEGSTFQQPLVEYFLKNDALNDPQLTDEMIDEQGILPAGVRVADLRRLALAVNEVFVPLFSARGIRCADFKLEFGLDADGILTVGDELSPDNFRLRDRQTGRVLDKDVFRFDLDDLIQTYEALLARLQAPPTADVPKTVRRYRAVVSVHSRPNILHPESKAIQNALHSLGYHDVEAARAGRVFDLTLTADSLLAAEKAVRAMAETLLSNPVIEDYQLSLEPVLAEKAV